MLTQENNMLTHYEIGPKLGQGGFGTVFSALDLRSGRECALKEIGLGEGFFEVTALRKLKDVSGVIRIFDCFYTNQTIADFKEGKDPQTKNVVACVIVLEKPSNCQDLFDFLSLNHPVTLETIQSVFRQLLRTVIECFDKTICHRDIKDENILVCSNGSSLKIVLIDFGCAAFVKDEPYTDFAGTIAFTPPEYFTKGKYYGDKGTVWSLGILLYAMVFGDVPWETRAEIVSGSLYLPYYPSTMHRTLSLTHYNRLTDLIRRCLCKREDSRIDLGEILKHPLFES